jgi:hypothetical protein
MMRASRALFFNVTVALASVVLVGGPAHAESPQDRTARVFEVVEWALENPGWSGNPFDLEATATFTHDGTDRVIATPMFYDGGDTWRFRFTPTRPGRWFFTTASRHTALSGRRGADYWFRTPDELPVYSVDDEPQTGWEFYRVARARLAGEPFVPRDAPDARLRPRPVLLEMRFLHTRHDVWDGPTTRRAMWQFILAGGAGAVWGRKWGEDSPPYDAQTAEQMRCFARFWRVRWQLDLEPAPELVRGEEAVALAAPNRDVSARWGDGKPLKNRNGEVGDYATIGETGGYAWPGASAADRAPGQETRSFADLPYQERDFRQLTWFGLMSSADATTTSYIDGVSLSVK